MPDTGMAAVHGLGVVVVHTELMLEPMDIMDGVVHGNTNADGGNSDGHHIQRDGEPSHDTQYGSGCKKIGKQGDQGNHP